MKKGGGGIGFILAIVGLVVLMLLAAKAWNAVMPTAAQALAPAGGSGAPPQIDDHGQTAAGDAVRSGTLPDLRAMERATDQHIRQIEDAAKKQD